MEGMYWVYTTVDLSVPGLDIFFPLVGFRVILLVFRRPAWIS